MPAPGRTVLAVGAHFDDCVFGIPGVLLQAVRSGYRVVVLNIIGDYTAWPPVAGRAGEFLKECAHLALERGVELRSLPYASLHGEAGRDALRAVAEVVAELQPAVAFMLWPRDRHPDHEVAAALSGPALRRPGEILGRADVLPPARLYAYDNGPRHTIGFEPNTFVDVSSTWAAAREWLGRVMAAVQGRPYDAETPDRVVAAKETIARYRGLACGVSHAEALWAPDPYPQQIF